MGNFKVGDKVEIIDASQSCFENGDIGTIKADDHSSCPYGVERKGSKDIQWHTAEQLKLIPKNSKKQRIKALENEASDLGKRTKELEKEVSELKLIVHELRERKEVTVDVTLDLPSTDISVEDKQVIEFEGQQYRKVDREAREGDVVVLNDVGGSHYFETNKPYKVQRDTHINGVGKLSGHKGAYPVYTEFYNRTPETVDVYELIVEDKQEILPPAPKTQNQLRAEIIEKAKGFVEGRIDRYQEVPDSQGGALWHLNDFKFVVNEAKRTVVVLCKGIGGTVRERGIAKCNPSDVFNEHIGKAIALGRALGLDVSEFEQAVQPTVKVEGQIVGDGEVSLTLIPYNEVARLEDGTARVHSMAADSYPIINDTNAIYGGVE